MRVSGACRAIGESGARSSRRSAIASTRPNFRFTTNRRHQPRESHFDLLQAFAPEALLRRALAHAEQEGYLAHEFGDSCLILPRSL